MSMKTRLDAKFVAAAGLAAVGAGMVENADAAIVYSGVVNLPIAQSTNGLYINVVTGAINEPGNTGGSTVPGWDINPWSSSGLSYFNAAAPAGGTYVQRTGGGATANLPFGEIIGAVPGGGRLYGGSAGALTGTDAHIATGDNLIGFRFQNEANANQTHYGWARIRVIGGALSGTGVTRTLVDYAYDDVAGTNIGAGVPAPGSVALLALGAFGLTGRRRK